MTDARRMMPSPSDAAALRCFIGQVQLPTAEAASSGSLAGLDACRSRTTST